MADQYVARFRASTPDQRRAAIIKLGKAGDPRAISVLQEIISGEADPVLQKLAAQAIQHLQKISTPPSDEIPAAQTGAIQNDLPAAAPVSVLINAPASGAIDDPTGPKPMAVVVEPPLPRVITAQQKKLAKSKLDQVITQQMAGQYKAALDTLVEAAHYDPDILNTTIGANLATTLTDLPRDQAIVAVLARSQSANVKKESARPTLNLEPGELFDTALEAAVLLIIFIFVFASFNVSAVSLINRLFSGLGGVMSQIGASNPAALATTVAQFTQGQSTANSVRAQETLQAESPGLANTPPPGPASHRRAEAEPAQRLASAVRARRPGTRRPRTAPGARRPAARWRGRCPA